MAISQENKIITMKKILVVEDGKIIRQLLKRFLEKDGHSIVVSISAEEALKMTEKTQFDLIIADIKLPKMDGISFYKHLVQIRPELKKRFIFISGVIPQNVIDFSNKTGNRYLQKPFRQLEIKEMISDIFNDNANINIS